MKLGELKGDGLALSLPMQIGDRRAAPGMTVLDNLRLKEENLRLKTLVQISPTT